MKMLVSLCQANTHHFPIKVGCRVIGELAQTGVKGAVTFTLISRLELNTVHSNVASVPPGLVALRLGDGLEYQLGKQESVFINPSFPLILHLMMRTVPRL